MSERVLSLLLLIACSDPAATEVPDDAENSSCSGDCLAGWWIATTGQCTTFCSLSPAPAECSESDCSAVSFYELELVGNDYQLYMAIMSDSARSFTAFTRTPGTWALPSECHLTLNPNTDPQGASFACSSMTVDLPARDWQRPGADLNAVLPATSDGLPLHRSY